MDGVAIGPRMWKCIRSKGCKALLEILEKEVTSFVLQNDKHKKKEFFVFDLWKWLCVSDLCTGIMKYLWVYIQVNLLNRQNIEIVQLN